MNTKMITRWTLLLALMLAAAGTAASQLSVQAGFGLGVRLPMADYAGETSGYYAGTSYGLSTGYALQAKGRLTLAGFSITGGLEYGRLSNSGTGEGDRGKVEVAQSIITFKVGPEFRFSIPALPLTPYVGGNIALHSISGTTTFQGLTKVPSETFDVESATRIGFGFNAGAIIGLSPMMSLDVGAEYALVNPLSKEWRVASRSDIRIDSYRSLNDDADPLYTAGNDDHFVSGTRSMAFFQIAATLMVGL